MNSRAPVFDPDHPYMPGKIHFQAIDMFAICSYFRLWNLYWPSAAIAAGRTL